jgi:tetratricopeptide (TPR) repeat protein
VSRGLRRALAACTIVVALAGILGGCSDPKKDLLPVPQSDVGSLEPSVRAALASSRATLDRIAASNPSNADLANAYGDLAMTYHAHSIVPPAEAAYADARMLAPRDKRWPYLLGHLYNDSSRVPEAIKAFEAALALDGNDVPTLFSLGEVYLQHGDFDKAQQMYEKMQGNANARASALTGLGKVALAKRQYQQAVDHLEEALKLAPYASHLRQPLAAAYRGLGNQAKAEENLREYRADGVEPEIVDPLAEALGAKVAASRALMRRGQRFGKAGRFDLAEPAFRAAVAADPTNAEALVNLGISLANLDRVGEAQRTLEQALAMDDTSALGHFSLAVIYDRQGQSEPAMTQYRAALKRDPSNLQALVYLADATMRAGELDEAAKLYRQAVEQAPASPRMHMSLAIARLKGGRYGEARSVLETALKSQPDSGEIVNALARILATAPVAAVRDGPRALAMAKRLFESTRSPEVGETYAMALAETGSFDQAVALQRETIIVVEHTGPEYRKPFLQRTLALYLQHKPAREAWASDDPIFEPRSPAARLVKASGG